MFFICLMRILQIINMLLQYRICTEQIIRLMFKIIHFYMNNDLFIIFGDPQIENHCSIPVGQYLCIWFMTQTVCFIFLKNCCPQYILHTYIQYTSTGIQGYMCRRHRLNIMFNSCCYCTYTRNKLGRYKTTIIAIFATFSTNNINYSCAKSFCPFPAHPPFVTHLILIIV